MGMFAAIQAGGDALGQLGGTLYGAAESFKASKNQRKFASYMIRHKYQIAVDDLKKAGLNPILAAGALGGGSTPTTSLQQVPVFGGPGVASATAALQKNKEEREVLDSTTDLNKANTVLARQLKEKAINDSAHSAAEAQRARAAATISELQIPGARIQADIDSGPMGSAYGHAKRISDLLRGTTSFHKTDTTIRSKPPTLVQDTPAQHRKKLSPRKKGKY